MTRNITVIAMGIMILILVSCSQNVETITALPYDYEVIEDETDGDLLGTGAVTITPDTISDVSPRGKLIQRGDYIWNKMTRTKYVHFADKIIDDMFGIYEYDCSGFAYAVILYEALPEHAQNLLEWKQQLHPTDYGIRANTFYDYFRHNILDTLEIAENEYWEVFTCVDSLKKGDFIIVRYDEEWRKDWINEGNHASTGHVMIAWDKKTIDADNNIEIMVYDCSSSGHTKSTDTRYCNDIPVAEINEDSGKPSGIGFGWMKYKVSESHHRPFAYKWSVNSTHWYNLREGDDIDEGLKYDRLEGIVFARPI